MEREENKLFKFATKELSQDAFICWCINWINYKDHKLYDLGKDMLNEIIFPDTKNESLFPNYEKGEIIDSLTPKELANNVTGMLMTHILDRRITYHKKTFKQEFMENLNKWLDVLKVSEQKGD